MSAPEKSYRRSISLPKHLAERRPKSLRQSVPIKPPVRLASASHHPNNVNQSAISELCAELDILEPRAPAPPSPEVHVLTTKPKGETATEQALRIPEILFLIFEQLDAFNVVPHELSQRRRKPMSLRHAQLIYGDKEMATIEWQKSKKESSTASSDGPGAGLHACLQVNSLWNLMAKKVLQRTLHFASNDRWRAFLHSGDFIRCPQTLVIHKLSDTVQLELDQVAPKISGNLNWLELYTCPGLSPTPELLRGGQITKLVLPGCARINDRTLAQIAEHCPKLEYLDLRACELVSDKGLKIIAKYCPQLSMLNVGRTRNGELVTYKGIKHIARQTQLSTLGIAGCAVDDRAIWELALNRGPALQRLSLNNCQFLTDASIPRILGYTPNLSVLEIRGCLDITNMRPIALFKRFKELQGQPPLIEGCEVVERRIQHAVQRLKTETSNRILSDCLHWVNLPDNDHFYLA